LLPLVSITFPTITSLVQHDLHGSFKNHPSCNSIPTPSLKPTQKPITIELQTSNTTNLQTNKTHQNIETNNKHWTFGALKIHDEQLFATLASCVIMN
jgi:hypothetical protein